MSIKCYIYPTSLPVAGCNAKSIFKLIKAGLDLEFYFLIGCCIEVKKPSVPYYLTVAGEDQIDSCLSQGH